MPLTLDAVFGVTILVALVLIGIVLVLSIGAFALVTNWLG